MELHLQKQNRTAVVRLKRKIREIRKNQAEVVYWRVLVGIVAVGAVVAGCIRYIDWVS